MDFVNLVADAFKASGLPGNLYPFEDDDVTLVLPQGQHEESAELYVVLRRRGDGDFVVAFAAGTTSGDILFTVPTAPLTEESVRAAVDQLIEWGKAWVSSTRT